MAGAKQTPRQRLIGLMYLIFLALMALNVSVEVLDSFPLINNSIEETNRNFEAKVDMVYYDFDEQRLNFGESHVAPFHEQAVYVGALADSLIHYIRTNRTQMLAELNNISYEEADTMNLIDSRRKDNYSISSRFWLVENSTDPSRDGGPGTRAYILREKISNFKAEIDSVLALHDQAIKIALDVEGPFYVQDRRVNWQQLTFDRVISVAVATNLNRLITEVRNAQFDAINMLYDLITAGQFRFDEVTARVVPKSEIVMTGGRYEADVFVAAIDTRQEPQISVQGIGRIPVSDGIGRIRLAATTPGTHTIRGEITVVSPAGVRQSHPFTTQYTIERPRATVSATNMNMLYQEIENPVSISVPGVPSENIRPQISPSGQTRLTTQPDGTYIAYVQDGVTEATITVNAYIEGQLTKIDDMLFRARPVPRPIARIAGYEGGRISRQALTAAGRIDAHMGDDFVFAGVEWNVTAFDMITITRGEERRARQTDGSSLTQEMIGYINDAGTRQNFFFNNIIAEGPGGARRNLGNLSFTIN